MSVKGFLTSQGAVPEAQLIAANQVRTTDGTLLRSDGFKNYIREPDANYAVYWTASGAGVTVATTTTAAQLPDATRGSALAITRVSGTTAYVYARFTLDQADYNKKLQIVWDQVYAGVAADYAVQVWSNTASNYGGTSTQLSTPVTNIPVGTFTFNTTFDAPGSTAPYLEIRIVAVANTTPLYLANITVTPGQIVQGAASGPWTAYTPTFTGLGTVANISVFQRRNGPNVEIQGSFTTGTVLSSTVPAMSLPTGLNIDTAVITVVRSNKLGDWSRLFATPATNIYNGTSTGHLIYNSVGGGGVGAGSLQFAIQTNAGSYISTTPNNIFDSTQNVDVSAVVPVAEWAGNGTVNLGQGAQIEYASSTTGTWDAAAAAGNTVYGPSGSTISGSLAASRTKVVRFQYPIQTSDEIRLQYLVAGSWVDQESTVQATVVLGSFGFGGYILSVANTTDVSVFFNQFALAGTTYNSTTGATNWLGSYTGQATAWRLIKVTSSAPVGFGLASSTTSGLFPAAPTTMDDGLATTYGTKAYQHGTNYNGGNAPTITLTGGGGTLSSVTRSQFIPYQTQDGGWRLRFNMRMAVSSVSRGSASFAVNGMTFKNVSNYYQVFTATDTVIVMFAYGTFNTGTFNAIHAVATTASYSFSGDVELESKPTWAY